MEISKQLFEDVLSGKLKGRFVLRNKVRIETKFLRKSNFKLLGFLYKLHYLDAISAEYTEYGKASCNAGSNFDIIDFIPDTDMKENELTIEIPNGKEIDWDESKKQNKIILKDKQLTYEDICEKLFKNKDIFYIESDGGIKSAPYSKIKMCIYDETNATAAHQLECILAKNILANVAVYLNDGWKPNKGDTVFTLTFHGSFENSLVVGKYYFGIGENQIIFKTQKVAQQAIEILGEETVKLALEPLGI